MNISIIIPTYNRREMVVRLIESIIDSNFGSLSYEIIVIDDCSCDDTVIFLTSRFGKLNNFHLYVNSKNERKSYSVNRGIKKSKGAYYFIVDDDTVVNNVTIYNLYKYSIETSGRYILSPVMLCYNSKNVIWFAGLKVNFWNTTGDFLYKGRLLNDDIPSLIDSDAIVTAFMFSRNVVEDIGYFNERVLPFQFEEIDYCVRAGFAGYKSFVLTSAKLWHDHEVGVFLNNPWRLYFEVRNRIITSRLWSRSFIQYIISFLSSLLIPFLYFFIKFVYRKEFLLCYFSIIRGVVDGLSFSFILTPYRKRRVVNLKKEIF